MCRKETTHPPRHSFAIAYNVSSPDAVHVPIAAPAVPKAGMGPRPRISTTLKTMFSTVSAMPRRIGVRASPAERSAPASMKNTSMPLLKANMMRRKGSASAFTAGAAFTRSSSQGEANQPTGASTRKESASAVMNAWYTVRSTFSSSPAPANRATSTLMPVNSDMMKTMTTMKIWLETPIAALPVKPTNWPTSTWSMMPCIPPTTLVSIVGQASFQTAAGRGPSTIERSYRVDGGGGGGGGATPSCGGGAPASGAPGSVKALAPGSWCLEPHLAT